MLDQTIYLYQILGTPGSKPTRPSSAGSDAFCKTAVLFARRRRKCGIEDAFAKS
jgi:hypothetical protein